MGARQAGAHRHGRGGKRAHHSVRLDALDGAPQHGAQLGGLVAQRPSAAACTRDDTTTQDVLKGRPLLPPPRWQQALADAAAARGAAVAGRRWVRRSRLGVGRGKGLGRAGHLACPPRLACCWGPGPLPCPGPPPGCCRAPARGPAHTAATILSRQLAASSATHSHPNVSCDAAGCSGHIRTGSRRQAGGAGRARLVCSRAGYWQLGGTAISVLGGEAALPGPHLDLVGSLV